VRGWDKNFVEDVDCPSGYISSKSELIWMTDVGMIKKGGFR
jgi:hypothetical protein